MCRLTVTVAPKKVDAASQANGVQEKMCAAPAMPTEEAQTNNTGTSSAPIPEDWVRGTVAHTQCHLLMVDAARVSVDVAVKAKLALLVISAV